MILTADNRIVNGLWIGDTLSLLELLTIKSFIRQGHIFQLWLYKPIQGTLPAGVICKDANTIIPENQIFRYTYKNQFGHGKNSLGGFSDIFRYKLLYEQGGWWTDMDVTCIKPLQFEQPYVFRTHNKLQIVGNILKCPANSLLMKNCYERAVNEITETNRDWFKPIKILVNEVKKQQLEKYIIELSNPDSWKYIRKLLIRNVALPENWSVIHWVNEEWRRNCINKNIFLGTSTLGKLMSENLIQSESINFISLITYRIKLTYVIAGLRQLPSFISRRLKN